MASCNSWQYLVTILAKIFPRSWQDLAKILLRYPWRVDPGGLEIQEISLMEQKRLYKSTWAEIRSQGRLSKVR